MNLFQIRPCRIYSEKPEQSHFPPHVHNEYEIFVFLSGDANYSVEGTVYKLSPGDILLLKNIETHNLILKSDAPYKRITIHFKASDDMSDEIMNTFSAAVINRPIGYYNLYSSTYFDTKQWLYYIEHICDEKNKIKQQIYLLVLLQELASVFPQLEDQNLNTDTDIVIKVTHYIDRHLADCLNLDVICKRFSISEAQLSRTFKKNLGTTVGDYILTKRLMHAHNLIEGGLKPTQAYAQCGFNDYSSFYRAYKKKFECAPKETKSNPQHEMHEERIEFI